MKKLILLSIGLIGFGVLAKSVMVELDMGSLKHGDKYKSVVKDNYTISYDIDDSTKTVIDNILKVFGYEDAKLVYVYLSSSLGADKFERRVFGKESELKNYPSPSIKDAPRGQWNTSFDYYVRHLGLANVRIMVA